MESHERRAFSKFKFQIHDIAARSMGSFIKCLQRAFIVSDENELVNVGKGDGVSVLKIGWFTFSPM